VISPKLSTIVLPQKVIPLIPVPTKAIRSFSPFALIIIALAGFTSMLPAIAVPEVFKKVRLFMIDNNYLIKFNCNKRMLDFLKHTG
jgi:hypothetical protein